VAHVDRIRALLDSAQQNAPGPRGRRHRRGRAHAVQQVPLIELRVHFRVGRAVVGTSVEQSRGAGRPWIVVAVVSAGLASALSAVLEGLW
jgi:hypothetical protein